VSLLEETVDRIEGADTGAAEAAQRALDAKTKPRGSLGRLEELAVHIAGIRRTPHPGRLKAAVVVVAADQAALVVAGRTLPLQ
jgi:nicotinate-nucleotide--dimethylbenzimidazole phosphoribosyltransferase